MIILGLAGGFNTPSFYVGSHFVGGRHDAASVLLRDGDIVAAMEEERLNRIKHSSYFPERSLQFCLRTAGITLWDVDLFAWAYNQNIEKWEKAFHRLIGEGKFGRSPDGFNIAERIVSMDHHVAHGLSSYALSGFENSLIYVIDGSWGGRSGLLMVAEAGRFHVLRSFPYSQSIGVFYTSFLSLLGFQSFDQYKVMGLAPYGDAARFRETFKKYYSLLPDGNYELNWNGCVNEFYQEFGSQNSSTQIAKDIAAGLQETLEQILFHVIRHYRTITNQRQLCLAGGVALNCSFNGKLLHSGLFDDIYIPSAPHDAGLAIGAAFAMHYKQAGFKKPEASCTSVYWGTDIGSDGAIEKELVSWSGFLTHRRSRDIYQETAEAIAKGAVVGWVQGRSEFGPRALGNRSILADPRPKENRDRINAMIKKREAFRPFAPAVLEDRLIDFFEVPNGIRTLPFMVFTLMVRKEKQELLGAVTHVDGSARVQTVSKATNPAFYELLLRLNDVTGVPVILNTSFNSNREPIVDSIYDSIACYLTTGLDYLIIGNWWIERRSNIRPGKFLDLIPEIPDHIELIETKRGTARGMVSEFAIRNRYYLEAGDIACQPWSDEIHMYRTEIFPDIYRIFANGNGSLTAREALNMLGIPQTSKRRKELATQLFDLWCRRFVMLRPKTE